MAAIIHCDMCRLVIALDECEPGSASLLTMLDVISKLYEAKNWFTKVGAKELRAIAAAKSRDRTCVETVLKNLKSKHRIADIDRYAAYRNKIGYHYDPEALDLLLRFGQEDSEAFYDMLLRFVRFSHDWAELTKKVLQEHEREASVSR